MRARGALLLSALLLAACVQKAPTPEAAKPVAMGGIIPADDAQANPVPVTSRGSTAKPAPTPAPAAPSAPAAPESCLMQMVGGAGYACVPQ